MFKKLVPTMVSVFMLVAIKGYFLISNSFITSDGVTIVGSKNINKTINRTIKRAPVKKVKTCEKASEGMGLKISIEASMTSSKNDNLDLNKEALNIDENKEVIHKDIGSKNEIKKEAPKVNKPTEEPKEEPKKESVVDLKDKEPVPVVPKDNPPAEKLIKDLPQNFPVEYRGDIEQELLSLVNKLRSDNGLPPYAPNGLLNESSRYKSNSMIQFGYFSHNNPNYNNENSGYLLLKVFRVNSGKVGENIAMYTDRRQEKISAKGLFDLWYNSEPHRKTMLSDSYTKIGIGVVTTIDSEGRIKIYGTQHFAK